MGKRNGKRLPNNSRLRLVAITERSASDPKRPKMDPETELRLHRIEVESAACYADMEDAAARFYMVAQALGKGEDPSECVPAEIEAEASVVHHLEDLSAQLKVGVGD